MESGAIYNRCPKADDPLQGGQLTARMFGLSLYYLLFSIPFDGATLAAFGWFFAIEERKSRVVGILIALAGFFASPLLLLGVYPWGIWALNGIAGFASLYVAVKKNRSRAIWTISTLLLGAPLLAVLLFLPPKSAERIVTLDLA